MLRTRTAASHLIELDHKPENKSGTRFHLARKHNAPHDQGLICSIDVIKHDPLEDIADDDDKAADEASQNDA